MITRSEDEFWELRPRVTKEGDCVEVPILLGRRIIILGGETLKLIIQGKYPRSLSKDFEIRPYEGFKLPKYVYALSSDKIISIAGIPWIYEILEEGDGIILIPGSKNRKVSGGIDPLGIIESTTKIVTLYPLSSPRRREDEDPKYTIQIAVFSKTKERAKEIAGKIAEQIIPRPSIRKAKRYVLIEVDEKILKTLFKVPKSLLARSRTLTQGRVKYEGTILIGHSGNIPVCLDLEDLKRHVYVIGSTGSGKTNFLKVLASEIIKKHEKEVSLWILDPHGDLAESIALEASEKLGLRYLDPTKGDVSINPLSQTHIEDEMDLAILTDELLSVFSRMFNMDFNKAPYVRLLLEIAIKETVRTVPRPSIPILYEKILEMYKKSRGSNNITGGIPAQTYISALSRLHVFQANKRIRRLFNHDSLNFEELIRPGNIVIWRIPKAGMPENIVTLMMNTIILKLWFTVKKRQSRRERSTPVIVIVDEFQNIQNLKLLEVILSEARKFGLHLVMAHQSLSQIRKSLLDIILGNTAVQVFFRLSGKDARVLSVDIDWASSKDILASLPHLTVGEAIIKINRKEGVSEPILVKIGRYVPTVT